MSMLLKSAFNVERLGDVAWKLELQTLLDHCKVVILLLFYDLNILALTPKNLLPVKVFEGTLIFFLLVVV